MSKTLTILLSATLVAQLFGFVIVDRRIAKLETTFGDFKTIASSRNEIAAAHHESPAPVSAPANVDSSQVAPQQKEHRTDSAPSPATKGPGERETAKQESPQSEPDVNAAWLARTTVDHALAIGTWTRQDVQSLRQTMAHLSEAERTEVLEKVGGAINRQELKTDGPPF